MPPKLSGGFSFLRGRGSFSYDEKKADLSSNNSNHELAPSLKLETDKDIYRPGDSVISTIEIWTPDNTKGSSEIEDAVNDDFSFLVENLAFEIKGIEKLDTQWFTTQKPLPGSKQRRGEQVFLDCTTPSIVSKVIVSSGCTKTYIVRADLPKIIPPSYRGTTIRYLYYVRSTLYGRWLALETGHSYKGSMKDVVQLEARAPLQMWVTQKTNSLLNEGQNDGTLPATTIQMDIYWKEKETDSEWARANEIPDGVEEGYESSRDEISSVSSYNPTKGNIDLAFRNSLSLQPTPLNLSNKEALYPEGERSGFPSYLTLPRLSVSEVIDDSSGGILSPSQQRKHPNSRFPPDEMTIPSSPRTVEPAASEGFIRGRSYNIRMDDQVLLRFSPKNSDSTYYFSDMIGGTLTFFHEEGARRCLEVAITLETSETVSQRYIHPSRRNSPTITKVQSDHHEVVADLVQTSFLFSIPMDGPMSFSTPYVSVQWALRFEFFTTPKNVDWTRYEHPLLIEGRDKGEWVLPITVHAPPPRTQAAHIRNEKPLSLGALWVRS
ncbi:immunoglobulin [Tasmannia lanceolata]|uniref:immunoglobulin n=1 Tax=Tasmannia lanceolata TaxID=3420 RepID=UPI0040631FFE